MNRRAFFGTMIGGVAAAAAVRSWPFRVFSFPTDIRIAGSCEALELENVREQIPVIHRTFRIPFVIRQGATFSPTGLWVPDGNLGRGSSSVYDARTWILNEDQGVKVWVRKNHILFAQMPERFPSIGDYIQWKTRQDPVIFENLSRSLDPWPSLKS